MKPIPNLYFSILSWIVTLLVPVVLILGAVRLVFFPWYLDLVYRTPNFPADPYGFSLDDRLRYSHLLLNFMSGDVSLSYLRDLHFPSGQQAPPESCQLETDCTRLFNDRELSHLVDAKNTYDSTMLVWYASFAILVVLGIYAFQRNWGYEFRAGLSRGGWLTIFLLLLIIVVVLLSFTGLFIFFHEIFFTQGNWAFFTSDTLIRVLPEEFWKDGFLTVGGLSIAMSLLLIFIMERVQRFLYYR